MCGIFGIFTTWPKGINVASRTYLGLIHLQHRGQEAAGMAVTNGKRIVSVTRKGRVTELRPSIKRLSRIDRLPVFAGIGHTRYSNTGSNTKPNYQPFVVTSQFGDFGLVHNGNLIETDILAEKLESFGLERNGTSDSEMIALLISHYSYQCRTIEEAITLATNDLKGSFALIIMTYNKIIGVRDPWGIRPISLGKLNGDTYLFSSETYAFGANGAQLVCDLQPGEMIVIDGEHTPQPLQIIPFQCNKLCSFCLVYVAAPASDMMGRLMQTVRRHMGEYVWFEDPMKIKDPENWVVCGVPDTGLPPAKGYADASGINLRDGLIKNRYVDRTFIEPDQKLREMGVRTKLQALPREVHNKKVIVLEDSIVRGTTSKEIVRLLFEAGALEVHMRITSPPYQYRCHFGIDTQYSSQLIAATHTVEQIREKIGATSLRYLSIEGMIDAINKEKYASPISCDDLCLGCFNGKYPIELPEE